MKTLISSKTHNNFMLTCSYTCKWDSVLKTSRTFFELNRNGKQR